MMRLTLVVVALLLGSSIVHADLLPFFGNNLRGRLEAERLAAEFSRVEVSIETTNKDEPTRLIIPRKMLGDLRTAALTDDANPTKLAAISRPTFAIGLCVTMAVSLAGLRGMTKLRPAVRKFMLLTILSLLAAGVAQVADARMAPRLPPVIPPFSVSGSIVVEVVEEGDAIRLVLNKNTAFKRSAE